MNILIQPYAAKTPHGKTNPKNYPHWKELIERLEAGGHIVFQIGVAGEELLVQGDRAYFNLEFSQIKDLLDACDTWICCDSFLQHFAWLFNRPGYAIFGPSDPLIFGHPENTNFLVSRDTLRPLQFGTWDQCDYAGEWPTPAEIFASINKG